MVSKERNTAWEYIYNQLVKDHNFKDGPKLIQHCDIKNLITNNLKYFPSTTTREIRTLCSQTKKSQRPDILTQNNLFLL